ncbi:hypothetical protein G7054_g11614 [Neopestalotiopsis clavispora]|nr:hypothetical protein G7054_g11614 [Neopestalotiopsis clavispora]
MKSLGIFGRVFVGAMILATYILLVAGQGMGGDNIRKIAPMIPESDLLTSATHHSASIMTSVESGALMTSVHADVSVAPTVSVHPKVARPFEAEPHHVGNGSLVVIGRALDDNSSGPTVTTTRYITSSVSRTTTIIDHCLEWSTATVTTGHTAASQGQQHHALPTPDKYNTSAVVAAPHASLTTAKFDWAANATAAFATGGGGSGLETAALATGASGGGAMSTAGGPYYRPSQTPYANAGARDRYDAAYGATLGVFVIVMTAHVATHVFVLTLRYCYGLAL